ncbi:MAG: hypothetical protein ABEH40_08035 [Haloferacaceae archaeon]
MVRVNRRGQFVLAAAVVVAVALVPMVAAYAQLGYPADAAADRADRQDVADARRALDAAAYRAAQAVVDADDPSAAAAAERVNRTLSAAAAELDAAGTPRDRAYRVRGNATVAGGVARADCPAGDRRRFGACRAIGGVVLQDRLGAPVVVAAAVDLRIDGPATDARVTVVLRPYR